MSASSTQFTFFVMIPTVSASSASCGLRPGRNPYEKPRSRPHRRHSAPPPSPAGRSCPPAPVTPSGRLPSVRLWVCRPAGPAWPGTPRASAVRRDPGGCPPGPPRTAATSRPSTPGAASRFRLEIRLPQAVDVIDVVPERREPHPLILSCCLPYPLQRTCPSCRSIAPALCPVPVLLVRIPLGQAPSLRPLRQPASHLPLFAGFSGTTGLSDFPRPFIAVVLLSDSRRGPRRHLPWADMGSPGSRAESFRACMGSPTARGPVTSSRWRCVRCCLPRRHDSVGTPKSNRISRLNTQPARSPVNASPAPLRPPTHDSGPVWLARPSPYGTFIHYTLPVFTGAPIFNLQYLFYLSLCPLLPAPYSMLLALCPLLYALCL